MTSEEVYVVEQGMANPRDRSIGWRHWDVFIGTPEGKAQAIRAARKLGIGRVLACKCIWTSKEVAALERP